MSDVFRDSAFCFAEFDYTVGSFCSSRAEKSRPYAEKKSLSKLTSERLFVRNENRNLREEFFEFAHISCL